PNHVHILFQPIDDSDEQLAYGVEKSGTSRLLVPTAVGEIADNCGPLAGIMHSLKSYTANQANKLLGRARQFWQHESYDHWVRDDEELERIVEYIAGTPVTAGLVDEVQEWGCCSARDRFLRDGLQSGWLGDCNL